MRSILVAAAASLIWAGAAHAQESLPAAPRPYAEAFGNPVLAGFPNRPVPPLFQQDPRWGDFRLGRWDTIRESGCALMIFTRIALKRGFGDDPVELIRYLSSEFVQPDGKLKTSLLDQAFPGMPKPQRSDISGSFNGSLARRVELELERGSDVALVLKKGGRGYHWVQVEEVNGNDLLIFDPGRRESFASLSERYGAPRRGSKMVVVGPGRKLG